MACQFDRRRPELTRNLVKLYARASETDIVQGENWYPSARRIVMEWATNYCLHDATVACVIAAISPQCEWSRNLIIADDILAGRAPSIGGIHKNIAKAQLIRDEPAPNMLKHFPCGPKVFSFACNLAGDNDVVTVDTHAMQAALADVQARYTLKWQPYTVFAECYKAAAAKVHRSPAEFQAIIWHVWKRLHPRTSKLIERRQWHVVGELED